MMNSRKILLILQILIHCCFFAGLFFVDAYWAIFTILICHIVFVGACGTVLFHRVIAHKNKINPLIEKILLMLSTIGASGSAIAWAGTHRMHHRFSDTPRDPHSPQHAGIIKTYWYSSGGPEIIRYVPDLLRKPLYLFQHKYYFQLLLMFHVVVLLTCSFSIYWAICIVPAFMMWFAGSTINCLGHDNNGPINSNILGLLFAGEGWHKNHHDQPASTTFNDNYDLGSTIYKMIKE